MRNLLKSTRSQISETIMWIAAYIIIFVIILVFILIGVALSKDKKVETISNNLDYIAVNSFVMMLNNTVKAANNLSVYELILKADDSSNRDLIEKEIDRFISVSKPECYIIKTDDLQFNSPLNGVMSSDINYFLQNNGVEIRIADKVGKEVKMGVFIGKC